MNDVESHKNCKVHECGHESTPRKGIADEMPFSRTTNRSGRMLFFHNLGIVRREISPD